MAWLSSCSGTRIPALGRWVGIGEKPGPRHKRRAVAALASAPASRLLPIELGKLLSQPSQFGQIVVDDIRVMRMASEEVLVVALGGVEILDLNYLGHHRS